MIGNGWWWSSTNRGLSDAELAAWIPRSVINASDVIGGDFYQGNANGESPATKMDKCCRLGPPGRRGQGARGRRVQRAERAGDHPDHQALATDSLWAWGCLWNANGSGGANSSVLSGDRLATFKAILAAW